MQTLGMYAYVTYIWLKFVAVLAEMQTGPFVKLQLGQETSFYVDNDVPTHCFCPCGHMASEKSVK